MTPFDWPGLMRMGLKQLGLSPAAFWALTPVEFMILVGADEGGDTALGRARLNELIRQFPDRTEETCDE